MEECEIIRIGDVVLNPRRGRLEDGSGAERVLRAKSFRVLELLLARRGELVARDDLLRDAWPDVIVSDDSLAQCISDIRRALGPRGAALLRTVPRRGYVLEEEKGSAPPKDRPQRTVQFGAAAVVVVVFAGLGWLTKPAEPDVPPATSDRAMAAEALLDGRDWQRRETNEQARALLQTAVATDPDDAKAWADLGLTYWLEVQHLAWGGGRREMARAIDMIERAVARGGGSDAHRLLAEMRLLSPFPEMRSPVDALANARAAVTIEPGETDNLAVLAHVLALSGHGAEAVRHIERALHLDPTPPGWYRQVAGLSYLVAGEPARAAEAFGALHGAGTFTGTRWWPGWLLASSLAQAGRTDEAAAIIQAAEGRRPERSIAAVAQSLDGWSDHDSRERFLDGLRRAGLPD
ncbi:winged helix-turn-helix domain-containing protein [Limimaricola pyoseonensis]|uniref:Transcriptional regulatory protein, C terminal n=1 Tax=Limimaricola pyoseonensis TaxID=521013 RepID=A0A1G7K472_9RHOB|nr:winged helix-turn-helix domain-containing protein [Limimaricola pyoseonensis]SDF32005.1 Transcriptional regulatory protein, C terminal [Limimaricola pyoseonensis]